MNLDLSIVFELDQWNLSFYSHLLWGIRLWQMWYSAFFSITMTHQGHWVILDIHRILDLKNWVIGKYAILLFLGSLFPQADRLDGCHGVVELILSSGSCYYKSVILVTFLSIDRRHICQVFMGLRAHKLMLKVLLCSILIPLAHTFPSNLLIFTIGLGLTTELLCRWCLDRFCQIRGWLKRLLCGRQSCYTTLNQSLVETHGTLGCPHGWQYRSWSRLQKP